MEGSDMGDNYEDEAEKREYVKKEYFAKPYNSDGITATAVNNLIIKNSRYLNFQIITVFHMWFIGLWSTCAWLSKEENLV